MGTERTYAASIVAHGLAEAPQLAGVLTDVGIFVALPRRTAFLHIDRAGPKGQVPPWGSLPTACYVEYSINAI